MVVIIMGLLAGLSIPNYNKTKAKNDEKAAFRALMVIKQAANMYLIREEQPTIPDMANINAISTSLGISLYEIDNITIACLGIDGIRTNQCTATHTDGWALRFNEEATNQAYCSNGTCPSCDDDASGGCSNLE